MGDSVQFPLSRSKQVLRFPIGLTNR